MGSRGVLGGEAVGHGSWLEFGRVKEKLMTEADQGPGISMALQISESSVSHHLLVGGGSGMFSDGC